ncbi:MAG: transporter substrate-binding domain-containing protein [Chitinispirillaceae bacterium]|nr:transporter substrate-binding domain-containing protein [Chitinispirillaceae bacterium]
MVLLFCLQIIAGPGTAIRENPGTKDPILSGCEFDYPPYSIVTPDSQADGFSVELLRAALGAMGYGVIFEVGPWSAVRQGLVDGKFQVLPLVGRTPERENLFDFTFPYLRMHGTIVVRDNDTAINGISDLEGKVVAVLKGDNAEEFIRRNDLGATVVTTTSFEDALFELSRGQHDAVIIQKLLALQLMKKMGLSNLRTVGPPLESFVQQFCFAVQKGDHALLGTLNEGLALTIADGTFNTLYAKWFTPIEMSDRPKTRIIVGGDNNYPPYEFIDTNGEPAGYNVDLTRAVARAMHLNVEIRLGPWNEIRSGLENGGIDIVHGMFYSPERDRDFQFSAPHTLLGHVIITRKEVTGSDQLTLDSLSGKKIVVMKGDIMHDFALSQGFDSLTIIEASSQEKVLSLVAEGMVDFALVARVPALYWIKHHHWKNLRICSRSLLDAEYCYSVLPGNDNLLELFSEGLQTIENSGEYHSIYSRWLGTYDKPEFSIIVFIRYTLIVIVPVVLLLLVVLVWTQQLKRQVRQRTAELRDEIIERKRAQQEVATEKERLSVTLHSISDGVVATDTNGCIEFMNPVAETLCGRTTEDAIGKPFPEIFSFIDETTRRPGGNPIEPILSGEMLSRKGSYRILPGTDGTERLIAESGAPIRDTGNSITGAVLVLRDITEQQKLIETVQRSTKLESLGVLAGGIAHDFNNLMGGIFGYIDIAAEASDDPVVKTRLTKAMNTIQRARGLTRQLLTFAKGGAPVRTVSALVPFVEETARFTLGSSSVSLTAALPGDIWTCNLDRGQISQVIDNIIRNAGEAMPDGGAIHITAENLRISDSSHPPLVPGYYVRLSIEDNGSGIPKEALPRIFDPFFTTKMTGHGLGLSTGYSIINRHGGTIEVSSEVNKGSVFHIYLPSTGKPAEVHNALPAINHEGRGTILIMDDEEIMRETVGDMLRSFGYDTILTSDGTEAVERLRQELTMNTAVTAAIFDLTVPGGTGGKDAVSLLRKIHPALPVFVASGYAADPVMAHPESFGFTASICKPFSKEELAVLLESTLSHA